MKDKKRVRLVIGVLLALAILLITDQLYLFGIPIGGFLGDLSAYDITGSPDLHHWMVGVVLFVSLIIITYKHKKEVF